MDRWCTIVGTVPLAVRSDLTFTATPYSGPLRGARGRRLGGGRGGGGGRGAAEANAPACRPLVVEGEPRKVALLEPYVRLPPKVAPNQTSADRAMGRQASPMSAITQKSATA